MSRCTSMALLICLGFLFGCETTSDPSFRTPSLGGDAGTDEPASWEGDWTWEEPVETPDASCGSVVETDAGSHAECPNGQKLQGDLRISVSYGLIPGCVAGHVIHLWGGDGEEYTSSPDQDLVVPLATAWRGWLAFNVTCGNNWDERVVWSATTLDDLVERGRITVTGNGFDLSESIKACASVTGSDTLLPFIPLTCGDNPC